MLGVCLLPYVSPILTPKHSTMKTKFTAARSMHAKTAGNTVTYLCSMHDIFCWRLLLAYTKTTLVFYGCSQQFSGQAAAALAKLRTLQMFLRFPILLFVFFPLRSPLELAAQFQIESKPLCLNLSALPAKQ